MFLLYSTDLCQLTPFIQNFFVQLPLSTYIQFMISFIFLQVNERVRANMYKLRQTWGEVFPQIKLYALDCRVNCIDPAWPITARPPTGGGGGGAAAAVGGAGAAAAAGGPAGTIHVNPNFLRVRGIDSC